MQKLIAQTLNLEMNRRLYLAAWLGFSLLTFILLSTFLRVDKFYFDAGDYFDASTYFFKGFTNFNISFRGYSFPLILAPCHIAAKYLSLDKIFVYRVFASVAHSFFIVVVLPVLIADLFRTKARLHMVAAFYAAILFFWYGLIVYPLTDLPSIYMLASAILLLRKWSASSWLATIAAGVALGLASNFRPIYLSVLPIVALYALYKSSGAGRRIIAGAALALGIFIAWLPQIIINKVNFDTYSPTVQTHIRFGGGLYFSQLNWGFAVERYEGGNVRGQRSSEVYYINQRAAAIIEKENLSDDPRGTLAERKPFETPGAMLSIIAKYPLDFAAIYAKHIFNALDPKYPESIIFDFDRSRALFSFLNYTFVFFGLFLFLTNYKTVLFSVENLLILAVLLVPFVFVIPTQIEVRFGLPLQIIFYAAVCFCDWRAQFRDKPKSFYGALFLSYVAFVLLCFYVSSQTIGTEISKIELY